MNVLEDENMSHVNLHSKETHDELKSKEGITLIVKNHQTDNIQQTIDRQIQQFKQIVQLRAQYWIEGKVSLRKRYISAKFVRN